METTINNNVEVTVEKDQEKLNRSSYLVKKNAFVDHPKFDREKLMQAARLIIEAVGEDPNREGLRETPSRYAAALEEVLEGCYYDLDDICSLFNKTFETTENNEDLVTLCNIKSYMHCEHHIFGADLEISIGYIPVKGKIIGVSKLARIADMCAHKLTLQEKVGEDICDVIERITGSPDCITVVRGRHSCCYSRGQKSDSVMQTAALRGRFRTNSDLRKEFYSLLESSK